MIMKVIIILLLIAIIYCLGSAVYYMILGKKNSASMAKALTWRVSLSLLLFVLLFISYAMGWITPNNFSLM